MAGPYPEFAKLLTQYLNKHDRSPTWLAKQLHVKSVSTVTGWLNNEARPGDPKIVEKIAQIFKLSETEKRDLFTAAGYGYYLPPVSPEIDAQSKQTIVVESAAIVPPAAPLAFAPEAEDETLIVIAKFFVSEGNRDTVIYRRIRDRIRGEARKIGEHRLRVEIEPSILESDQRAQAEALGERYRASIVIWGDDTGAGVTVNFLNLRNRDLYAASVTISETVRSQIASPNAYNEFIVDELPNQIAFLSLFALGQIYFASEDDLDIHQDSGSTIIFPKNEPSLDPEIKAFATNCIAAIICTKTAIDLLKDQVKPEGLAEAYFFLASLYSIFPKFKDRVIDTYSQAIQLKHAFINAYFSRGIEYYFQSRLNEAIGDFNQVISLAPAHALAHSYRGLVLKEQEELDQAIESFNQSIRLDDTFAVAYIGRSETLYFQNRLDEAIDDSNRGIIMAPGIAEYYYSRGVIRSAQKRLDKAFADFNEAIRLNPYFAEAYRNRGIIYYQQGKLDEAVAEFNQAIQLKHNLWGAYLYRGIALYLLGKKENGTADMLYAKQLMPNFAATELDYGPWDCDEPIITNYIGIIELDYPNDAFLYLSTQYEYESW